MAYESRIYIIKHRPQSDYGEVIAVFNMCALGWSKKADAVRDCFNTPVDFDFYADDGNTVIDSDAYGDSLKCCTIPQLIEAFEAYEQTEEHYRRIYPMLSLLRGFDLSEWNELIAVHYGY